MCILIYNILYVLSAGEFKCVMILSATSDSSWAAEGRLWWQIICTLCGSSMWQWMTNAVTVFSPLDNAHVVSVDDSSSCLHVSGESFYTGYSIVCSLVGALVCSNPVKWLHNYLAIISVTLHGLTAWTFHLCCHSEVLPHYWDHNCKKTKL